MNFRKSFIRFIALLIPTVIFGQIKISENIQTSSIAKNNENALYFVDFWATWCGPCIHASKYLSALQMQYPDNFYILSLSQENPDVVKRFMKKHRMGLAVAIDFQGETFSKYNISSLPYGILFNAKGERLWEGHPAEFKDYHLDGYLSINKQKIALDKMFLLQNTPKTFTQKEVVFEKDFEIIKIPDSPYFEIKKHTDFFELKGSLQAILAYSSHTYQKQIDVPSKFNHSYRVRFKNETDVSSNLSDRILKALKLEYSSDLANGEALVLNIKNARFWDVDQIDWGNDSPHFLIGDSDLKADNVSLNQVGYQLANLLEIPVLIKNQSVANALHDWEIHYKYFELMASGLSDTYGIEAKKQVATYPKYTIKKKAP
ncbi:TlpA family protein disulfide reductase [Hyunsoonleella sp. SJ7]|uniref:TlpA family protein disulfide reductase n=1 Tax=Hyunsoonleella aquatilis TaxID=2762758 RepID=A0A923HAI8_9FLAO|nr:TlpA disulfide reductase family protein [Hyunsoonleella aquatilis]MBC3758794.1 TlpA family protein disulfide reductase [Hyunsoonleella aquatilis]